MIVLRLQNTMLRITQLGRIQKICQYEDRDDSERSNIQQPVTTDRPPRPLVGSELDIRRQRYREGTKHQSLVWWDEHVSRASKWSEEKRLQVSDRFSKLMNFPSLDA
ncbi:hypothetical protein B5807_00750 [Epicoccum nigrum]|jgi:hypothetical protein|uniref:Uncharacterized protein n=1 Tax=Epicoccum nigrum TaxID=105696 RepID=A0A1Y2MFQ7_EPING|nr:hypothetical protein B5807_00750 [Epicoccum nigrum]